MKIQMTLASSRVASQDLLTLWGKAPVLQSEADVTLCADIVRTANEHVSALDKARKAEKAPHLEAGRRVDETYSDEIERWKRVKNIGEGLIGQYNRALELERSRQIEAARASVPEDLDTLAIETPIVVVSAPLEISKMRARICWRGVVVNSADVPRAFCSPDEGLIKRHAAQWEGNTDPPPPVPGIQWVADDRVTVRK